MEPPREIKTPRGQLLELPLSDHVHQDLVKATTPDRIDAITCTPIDFANTDLPVYEPYFAVVLDNVFSPEECATIRDVPEGHWTGLVQGNAFREVDRTLVLNSQISEVLYARVQPHLERLGVTQLRKPASNPAEDQTDWAEGVAGMANLRGNQGKRKVTWDMYAANERLSYLRYSAGMHHDRHCDQVFSRPGMDKGDKSFLTCQVYLSDAGLPVDREELDADAAGGTTRFWGPPGTENAEKFVDVVPKAGRVLVFQQRMLWHSGQPVTNGLKYAMRTDLMYRRSFT